MEDYTKKLPSHQEVYVGENDLFVEIYEGERKEGQATKRSSLLFIHGSYTGSWMWSKYIPHFVHEGWKCYVMNLRGHYKSRSVDFTKVTFENYLEDIREVAAICGEAPIIIGFSLGGILCQKVAEMTKLTGLIVIDSSVSQQVNKIVPYNNLFEDTLGMVLPAPTREEASSIDESKEDINFQKKYLSMESVKALMECSCWIKGGCGISINSGLITCPVLVIRSLNSDDDKRRGEAEAEHLKGEYSGYWNTTHTGLLIGQKYYEIVVRILNWLKEHEMG